MKTFDLSTGENVSIFVGHKSEITTLAYDVLGHRLATGSKVRIFYKHSKIINAYIFYLCNRIQILLSGTLWQKLEYVG